MAVEEGDQQASDRYANPVRSDSEAISVEAKRNVFFQYQRKSFGVSCLTDEPYSRCSIALISSHRILAFARCVRHRSSHPLLKDAMKALFGQPVEVRITVSEKLNRGCSAPFQEQGVLEAFPCVSHDSAHRETDAAEAENRE